MCIGLQLLVLFWEGSISIYPCYSPAAIKNLASAWLHASCDYQFLFLIIDSLHQQERVKMRSEIATLLWSLQTESDTLNKFLQVSLVHYITLCQISLFSMEFNYSRGFTKQTSCHWLVFLPTKYAGVNKLIRVYLITFIFVQCNDGKRWWCLDCLSACYNSVCIQQFATQLHVKFLITYIFFMS